LFGQFSHALVPGVVATLGGRLTYAKSAGMLLDAPAPHDEPERTDVRFSPSAALTWHAAPRLLVYARFQQGFRAGGLAVSTAGAQRFESDSLTSWEAGMRLGRPDRDRLSFNAAFSYARWADIQADLIDSSGLPFTANLGDGRIWGFEAEASWRLTPTLRLEAAAFVNSSALSRPVPAFAAADERDLPNIPGEGARAALHFETPLGRRVILAVDGALRYVGHSQLGIGPPLDLRQGGYADGQLGARLDFGRFGLSVDLDNVADARGNRFAFGNPFSIAGRDQLTPLRPRTLRIGFDAAF
jgi:outer membrane receptor protein involved in Fe transport